MKKWPLQLAAMLCLIPSGNLQAAPATFTLFHLSLALQVQLAPEASHLIARELPGIAREFHGMLTPKRYEKDFRVHPRGVATDADNREALTKTLKDLQPTANCAIPPEQRPAPSSC
jgi:hypothetical protein